MMDTNELKIKIKEEAEKQGITLTEDELNAKVLEVSKMDQEKLDRLNGGGAVFNCTKEYLCWEDYICAIFDRDDPTFD